MASVYLLHEIISVKYGCICTTANRNIARLEYDNAVSKAFETADTIRWWRNGMLIKEYNGAVETAKPQVKEHKAKRQYVQLTHDAMYSLGDTYYCPACISVLSVVPRTIEDRQIDMLQCTSCNCKTVYNLQGEVETALSLGEPKTT